MATVNLGDLDIRQQATPTLPGDVKSVSFGGESGGNAAAPVLSTDVIPLGSIQDSSLNVAFSQVTTTGEIIKANASYNFKASYTFDGSTAGLIHTRYLGTFSSQQRAVVIDISDGGSSQGSSSRFIVSRHNSRAPTVSSHNGNAFAFYTLYYRSLTVTDFELFIDTSSTVNPVTVNTFASQQGAMVDTSTTIPDDAALDGACVKNLVIGEEGEL